MAAIAFKPRHSTSVNFARLRLSPYDIDMTYIDRFWAMVDRRSSNDCWYWLGSIDTRGYGTFHLTNLKKARAHRVALSLTGIDPTGFQVDHYCHTLDTDCVGTCEHRRCVNPAHLRLVTQQENNAAGRGIPALNALKTHCVNGHPLTGNNLRIEKQSGDRGYARRCRECVRLNKQRSRNRL